MTNLRQLLANNMKANRQALGLSQAKLAEKADLSTQYIAMIELTRKFPSPEKLEQIAEALEIDVPELFSMPPSMKGTLKKIQQEVLITLETALQETVADAVMTTISTIIAIYMRKVDDAHNQEPPGDNH
jgi:transcriptional regulator with XRE-family HTH domain